MDLQVRVEDASSLRAHRLRMVTDGNTGKAVTDTPSRHEGIGGALQQQAVDVLRDATDALPGVESVRCRAQSRQPTEDGRSDDVRLSGYAAKTDRHTAPQPSRHPRPAHLGRRSTAGACRVKTALTLGTQAGGRRQGARGPQGATGPRLRTARGTRTSVRTRYPRLAPSRSLRERVLRSPLRHWSTGAMRPRPRRSRDDCAAGPPWLSWDYG